MLVEERGEDFVGPPLEVGVARILLSQQVHGHREELDLKSFSAAVACI